MRRLSICICLVALAAGCVSSPPARSGPSYVTVTDSTGSADVNTFRASAGLPPLARSAALDAAAQAHAADMARNGFFGHRGSNGSTHGERIRAAGMSPCGAAENIADGPFTPSGVMAGWMGSQGHRRNILNRRYSEYGLARVEGKWVMTLAGRC